MVGRDGKILVVCALGQLWHPACFYCDTCNQPITFEAKGNTFYLFGSNRKEDLALLCDMSSEEADRAGYPCCTGCYEINPDPFNTMKETSVDACASPESHRGSCSSSYNDTPASNNGRRKDTSDSDVTSKNGSRYTFKTYKHNDGSMKKKMYALSFSVNELRQLLQKEKRMNGLRYIVKIITQVM